MEDSITIWTPVIISRLLNVQKAQEQMVHYLDQHYHGLEDVKIKIKKTEVGIIGKEIEIILNLDILCLVQNSNSDLQLVSCEEKMVNHIPLNKFSLPFTREPNLGFRVNITNLKCEGELKGHELKIRYGLDYMVLVLQDRIVAISNANSAEPKKLEAGASTGHTEDKTDLFRDEKDQLLRKVFCYERDIISLKKSIHKTENRNAALNRELARYQQLVKQLQKAVEDKNNPPSPIQQEANFSYWRTPPPQKDSTPFVARLKRMFITSL